MNTQLDAYTLPRNEARMRNRVDEWRKENPCESNQMHMAVSTFALLWHESMTLGRVNKVAKALYDGWSFAEKPITGDHLKALVEAGVIVRDEEGRYAANISGETRYAVGHEVYWPAGTGDSVVRGVVTAVHTGKRGDALYDVHSCAQYSTDGNLLGDLYYTYSAVEEGSLCSFEDAAKTIITRNRVEMYAPAGHADKAR